VGDYQGIIPLPDKAKLGVDAIVVPSAITSWVASINWPTVAAILACIYTALRIVELVYGWRKKKKK